MPSADVFCLILVLFFLICSYLQLSESKLTSDNGNGKWKILRRSIGISAMHAALMPSSKLIFFDRTDFGSSNISLPTGRCRDDARDQALVHDCTAHSVEFDPASRALRPLTLLTDTWCSSGALLPDGALLQTGGFNDGDRVVRRIAACGSCDWSEQPQGLAVRRWYATNQILPDGRIIVVGGRRQYNYEYIPKSAGSSSEPVVFDLPFLRETTDSSENNLYPFVHLMPDGNLFVFANTKAILLDYANNRVLRRYPEMPGGAARNYPSSGSSVLLPLVLTQNSSNPKAEIMVCGGAIPGSNAKATNGTFLPATSTCGRLLASSPLPEWEMEEMPVRRVMGDMVLLPTGNVLIINGAANGTAGWGVAREPVLRPVLYHTEDHMFKLMSPAAVPRLYHSTAHLLPDGRVVVGGSNPNVRYEFSGVLFPTELSVEAFSPPYVFLGPRPKIVVLEPGSELGYGQRFSIGFRARKDEKVREVKVTMAAPAFTTHSFSMNQRLLVMEVVGLKRVSGEFYEVNGFAPATAEMAPPGYYLLYVVVADVPSRAKWIRVR